MMKVCIIGAGVVGSYLAKKLSKENYEIAIVDIDSAKIEQLTYSYDILGINCDALEINCLKEVENFDLFVIVTESDEKNIAIAVLLKSIFQKKNIIVRVSNKAFSSPPVREFLQCETVNVLSETIHTVLSIIKYPFALSTVRLENDGILIFKYLVKVEDFLAGKQIYELRNIRDQVEFTIVAIERENEIIIPTGKTFIYPEDKIHIAVKEEKTYELIKALGIEVFPVKLVFVLGYSKVTEELLRKLSEIKDLKVKFLSPDKRICETISGNFPDVSVFHGELTDVELLKSENIGNADLTISLTENEETNILSAILAKRLGAKKTCSLVIHPEYEKIVESIGIDVPLMPRKLIASKVYRSLSKRGILELLELSENIDIVEFSIPPGLSGKKVSELGNKICNLIVAVKRGEKVFLARGDTELKKDDTVICIEKRK
jgi:trk system potassium uptake protein TrkA